MSLKINAVIHLFVDNETSNGRTLTIPSFNAKFLDLSTLFGSPQILTTTETEAEIEEITTHNVSEEKELINKSIDSSSGVTGDDCCSTTGSIEDEHKARESNGPGSVSDDFSVSHDDGLMDTSLDDQSDDDSEAELTNLNWLTELKNITNLSPQDLPILNDQPVLRFNKFITAVKK